ncbi:transposase [Actinacidiphila oryziradicis]|uniref:transposase n=1 Tax=Actinacidiphila oryziradicis TaxID=2571141 RepID=UPI00145E5036|nr:transposase [Actinacidiphila oryziradicis]
MRGPRRRGLVHPGAGHAGGGDPDRAAAPGPWPVRAVKVGWGHSVRQAARASGSPPSRSTGTYSRQRVLGARPSTQPGTLRINGHEYLQFRFAKADCLACPDRPSCTASATGPRTIALLPRPLHEIQVRNRLDQQTEQWQRRYAIRAGFEATLSQAVRRNGLRRTRYRGLAKTHVQHVLTAMACNLTRTADWIAETPRGRTRSSRFHTLCNAAAG